ncbi:MAG: formylglycine-generating enzyme family protein, partial [Magnetococcales bacterium]|nr:formylglycine-generating enzyme family protein [Magnetococcales bacterium]
MFLKISYIIFFILIFFPVKYAETSIDETAKLPIFTNSIGMKFVKVPKGKFLMGCSSYANTCPGCYCLDDEQPTQHTFVSKPYYIGVTEVTQGQWKKLMGYNPSFGKKCGDDCPVERVSYTEVQSFIKKLNIIDGNKYRLPTNVEWEYATRAGTTTSWSSGDSIKTLRNYAWTVCNSKLSIHPVGKKKPNPWGRYDVHGNVAEMTGDIDKNVIHN